MKHLFRSRSSLGYFQATPGHTRIFLLLLYNPGHGTCPRYSVSLVKSQENLIFGDSSHPWELPQEARNGATSLRSHSSLLSLKSKTVWSPPHFATDCLPLFLARGSKFRKLKDTCHYSLSIPSNLNIGCIFFFYSSVDFWKSEARKKFSLFILLSSLHFICTSLPPNAIVNRVYVCACLCVKLLQLCQTL